MQATTHFLHAVEDMRALYAAADAFVLASVRDPLPNAVLEAMASQTPVIAAASGGIPEMIDDSTGTLVESGLGRGFHAGARARVRGTPGGEAQSPASPRRRPPAFQSRHHVDAIRRVYNEVVAGSRQTG